MQYSFEGFSEKEFFAFSHTCAKGFSITLTLKA